MNGGSRLVLLIVSLACIAYNKCWRLNEKIAWHKKTRKIEKRVIEYDHVSPDGDGPMIN